MTQDITIYHADYQPTLDDVIVAWLHAKATHSSSVKTEQAYRENFFKFRALVQSAGYDLDADPALIAMMAQGWAAHATRKEQIALFFYAIVVQQLRNVFVGCATQLLEVSPRRCCIAMAEPWLSSWP